MDRQQTVEVRRDTSTHICGIDLYTVKPKQMAAWKPLCTDMWVHQSNAVICYCQVSETVPKRFTEDKEGLRLDNGASLYAIMWLISHPCYNYVTFSCVIALKISSFIQPCIYVCIIKNVFPVMKNKSCTIPLIYQGWHHFYGTFVSDIVECKCLNAQEVSIEIYGSHNLHWYLHTTRSCAD